MHVFCEQVVLREEDMNKVYCKDCKFIKRYGGNRCEMVGIDSYVNSCVHPKNFKRTTEDTWFEVVITTTHKDVPESINKNNNCKWFKK